VNKALGHAAEGFFSLAASPGSRQQGAHSSLVRHLDDRACPSALLCTGMTGHEPALVLLKVLGAQRQVGLNRDAVEPV
jgi:hypothetical protein